MELKEIHYLIGIGLVIITAAGAVWGTIKFAIPNLKDGLGTLGRRLLQIEGIMPDLIHREDLDKEIGRIDRDFAAHTQSCQRMVCGRIDELKGDLKVMDGKREKAKGDAISQTTFDRYQGTMDNNLEKMTTELKDQGKLLTRLDERVLMLLQANGLMKHSRLGGEQDKP